MPTNTYDVIVVGDDFSGVIAATLCARRGMRVLLAQSRRPDHSYKLGPHRLPTRTLPFIGMSSPAIKRVLDELHFDHLLKRKLSDHSPAFQLVGPDARIDVVADAEALKRELGRELRDANGIGVSMDGATVIAELLDPVLGQDMSFPPAGFWERREVGRTATRIEDDAAEWFAKVEQEQLARCLIELPAVLGTHCHPFALTPEARARAFELWRRGTPRLTGDWQTLYDVFLEKFGSHSGEVRTALVSEISFSWGKASGIVLEGGEELGADHIIAALPLADLVAMTESKQPKRLLQCAEKISPAGYRYTLNLLVGEAGVPEGMASTVLVVGDPEAPLIGDNALAVHVGPPDDEARVVVTVEVVCPAPEQGRTLDDTFADLRVGVRRRLEMVMPFFSDHVLMAHSPHEALPAEGVEGALELAAPLPAIPVWSSTLESYLGVSAVPYQVGIKHLTIGSTQVLTGLGLEGDFAVGWCAAKIATSASGKKKEPSKNELMAARR